MSEQTHTPLLPWNQTPMEGALVHSGATPAETLDGLRKIRTLYDPTAIPADWMPWLAWAWDVPIWPKSMPDEVRRGLLRDARTLHRRAGTLDGFRALARWAGGELRQAYTPRTRTFCGPTLSVAERDAFLARYPQLRLYPYRIPAARRSALLHNLYFSPRALDIPADSGAAQRWGTRASVHDRGSEISLTVTTETVTEEARSAVQTLRVADAGSAGRGSFCGYPPAYLIRSTAAARLYTVTQAVDYVETARTLHSAPLNPGLEPISLRWEWGADPGTRRGLHPGAGYCGQPLFRSDAAARLYRFHWLFDPDRTLTARGANLFMGAQRLRFPAFHAELRVRLDGRRPARQFSRWISGCLVSAPRERYRTLFDALRWGRAVRDCVQVTTRTRTPAAAGNTHRAGALIAGAYV